MVVINFEFIRLPTPLRIQSFMVCDDLVKEAIIREEGGSYNLYSHKGKLLGRHPSRESAVKQEQAIKANGG
jgi:hypothetical protein